MDDLNSVIIEGIVTAKPTEQRGSRLRTFTIGSHRHTDNTTTHWTMKTHTTGTARQVDSLQVNDQVRIVGRLTQREGQTIIIAEHIQRTKQTHRSVK